MRPTHTQIEKKREATINPKHRRRAMPSNHLETERRELWPPTTPERKGGQGPPTPPRTRHQIAPKRAGGHQNKQGQQGTKPAQTQKESKAPQQPQTQKGRTPNNRQGVQCPKPAQSSGIPKEIDPNKNEKSDSGRGQWSIHWSSKSFILSMSKQINPECLIKLLSFLFEKVPEIVT